MTNVGYWQTWAARQLYAMGCAPKLLAPIAPSTRYTLEAGCWLNPNCEIELRFNELQPVRPDERTFVFPDGARYEDILDAVQAAWLACKLNTVIDIAAHYGLYWCAEFAE